MITDTEFIRIGVIIGAHALNGRLKVYVITDIIDRFAKGNVVYLKESGMYNAYTVVSFTLNKGKNGLLALEQITDRDCAEKLKKVEIYIKKSDAELSKNVYLDNDSFYYYDLIGCIVYYQGEQFGEVADIIEAGAGEILIINKDAGGEVMIPFVKEMVDTDNILNNRIDINPVEGLLDI